MSISFSRFVMFMVLLALPISGANALQQGSGKGKGTGQGQGKGQKRQKKACQTTPELTFILKGEERWTRSPEEVLGMPNSYKISKGPQSDLRAIKITDILPKDWNGRRVSFISCRGKRINIPAPFILKRKNQYIINENRKGLLKLTVKNKKEKRVLMRNIHRIDVK